MLKRNRQKRPEVHFRRNIDGREAAGVALARLALCVVFFAFSASSQSVSIAPDCFLYHTFTDVERYPSAGYANTTNGCVSWTVTYYNYGFTALSLRLESAQDNNGVAGTWGAFTGTLLAGVNPNTATTQAFTVINGYNPWVSLNLVSKTGTGHVTAYAYGCKSLTCAAVVAAAAGAITTIAGPFGQQAAASSIPVVLASDQKPPVGCGGGALLQASITLSGSGQTQIIAASGTKSVKICHLSLSTVATEDIKVTQGTGSNCATPGTPADLTGLYKNVTGLAFDYGPSTPLIGSASQAICISQSAAQATGGVVIYSQE